MSWRMRSRIAVKFVRFAHWDDTKERHAFDCATLVWSLSLIIMVGDRESPCVELSVAMRRWMPHAGLVVFPNCGHTPNIEEPGSLASTSQNS